MRFVPNCRRVRILIIGLACSYFGIAEASTVSTFYRVDFSGVVDFGAVSLFGTSGNVFSGSFTYDASRISPVSSGPDPIVNTYNPFTLTDWTLNLGFTSKPVVIALPPTPYSLPLNAVGFALEDDSQGHQFLAQEFGPALAVQGATQTSLSMVLSAGIFTASGAVTWPGPGNPFEVNLSDFPPSCFGGGAGQNCMTLKATIPNQQFVSGTVDVTIQGHMTSWTQTQMPPANPVPLPPSAYFLFPALFAIFVPNRAIGIAPIRRAIA